MPHNAPNTEKFIELVLLVASRSKDDPKFGYTKLNKILFYCDFLAYGRLGSAMTWQPYQKLTWGPAARRMKPVEAMIQEQGWGYIEHRRVIDHSQQRLIPQRDANLSLFSKPELEIVDEVIAMLRKHGATSISELSHRFIGWRAARFDEDIPYETVLISSRPLTAAEKAYARDLEPLHG